MCNGRTKTCWNHTETARNAKKIHVSLVICVLWVEKHISPVIIASVCFPTQETHITRDMCSGEHTSRETTYDSDITEICVAPNTYP